MISTATPPQVLDVYLQNQFIGKLYSNMATLSFQYDATYVEKKEVLKLSVSLPLQRNAFDHATTAAFFAGLLPDDHVRVQLARTLHLSAKNTFALLKAIGGECAGAVSVYPEGVTPKSAQTPTYKILDLTEATKILSSLDKHPLMAGEEDIRISGAGTQNKLMISFVEGNIAIPTGNTPSTHIIKPAIKDLEASVHNEFFCMRLAQRVGLPVPAVEIFWLQEQPYYLVERYDRKREKNGLVTRLHQEDFCQALHIPPEIKYEDEAGTTLADCFGLLDTRIQLGSMAGKNKLLLLDVVIFNFIIGNGDAHGKNFSLLYHAQQEALAPFYDLLCTMVYSNPHKAKMAMKIGGKYKFKEVQPRHWEQLAEDLGFKPEFVKNKILKLSRQISEEALSLSQALNQNPNTASSIYEKILTVIQQHTKKLLPQ